ncbi:MAG: patatin-like phospholipase family protein [Reyranella sp.]|nr:patatin-like phospholipase family protein [Reyranella sp.]
MRECDIVMKGGITSGVVYPLTIVELSRTFRFRNIGGTSAGALAAAITAAAEHNRAGGGFDKVAAIPDEVASKLLGFFQPVPALKPVFEAVLAAQSRTGGAFKALRALALGYWVWTAGGAVGGAAVAGLLWWAGLASLCVPALLLGGVGAAVGLGWRLVRAAQKDLPANDFGLCPGLAQPGTGAEALTDWLARTIDEVAGRDPGKDDPLTFSDLWGPDKHVPRIRLDMMTTNLSMRTAHRLPFRNNVFMFRKSEFERLFPRRIVDYMVANTRPVLGLDGLPLGDHYFMPLRERLPVVVGARLSLSFPGLISAIPLYTRDRTLADDADQAVPQRCLFSDGGLTSNFPIHFFDRLFPATPTFAVALESWRAAQHGERRVHLPSKAKQGIAIPVRRIASLGAFVGSLVDAAKDWQDNLQSTLPGYRERIVHVALDDAKEGGLNLDMDADTIRTLVGYGRDAGRTLVGEFDFDEHRWRRFLVAAARIEETLDEMLQAYDGGPPGTEPFSAFLERYAADPESYRQDDDWLAGFPARVEALMDLARQWRDRPRFRDGRIPHPASDLRITARY